MIDSLHDPLEKLFGSEMVPIIPRDERGRAHVVALSGGKDSTCMALALAAREPRPYTFVCTPTGDELPDMVLHWQRLEQLLDAPLLRLMNGTLATQIVRNRMLPNVFSRWCTRLLKLKPFGEFAAAVAPSVAYVGLRADEEDREGTRPGGDSAPVGTDFKQDFPMRRWGWGIEEVRAFLSEKGIVIPARTDCARCPYQRIGEWYLLWKNHPAIYASAEDDEEKWKHTFRSPQRDSWPAGLKELRLRFESGEVPRRSLAKLDEDRENMCRACSL